MKSLNERIHVSLHRLDKNASNMWMAVSPIINSHGDAGADIVRVNHFLRTQLGLLDVDTTEARSCLTNETNIDEWMVNFDELIAPLIVEHGLPAWTLNC